MKELSPLSQQHGALPADVKDPPSQNEALVAAGSLLHSADRNGSGGSGRWKELPQKSVCALL